MKELTVDAKPESLRKIKDFIGAELKTADCPERTQNQLFIVIDEIFINIVQYAYDGAEGSAVVRFEAESEPRAIVLTFMDSGFPFDPLTAKTPDTSLKAEEREIGGLGIFIVRRLMDEVHYDYSDGKNILTIRKML